MAMESYIVRFYRRDAKNHDIVVGQVEKVGEDRTKLFKNKKELWESMSPPLNAFSGVKKKRTSKTKNKA